MQSDVLTEPCAVFPLGLALLVELFSYLNTLSLPSTNAVSCFSKIHLFLTPALAPSVWCFILSWAERQNKTSWVPQLQTALRKASSHLKTTETMISVRRGPEDNMIPALSPRPPGCMNCTHLSPHTRMSSLGKKQRRGWTPKRLGVLFKWKNEHQLRKAA